MSKIKTELIFPKFDEEGFNQISDDPRSAKTLILINDSLLELLTKKSFHKISVTNICDAAHINRSTFYAHFEDKYQLLESAVAYMVTTLSKQVLLTTTENTDFFVNVFKMVRQYQFLFEEILVNSKVTELRDLFQDVIAENFYQIAGCVWKDDKKDLLRNTWDMVASEFYAGAIVAVIIGWLKNDMKVSEEEMATCLNKLMSQFLKTNTLS